MRPSHELALAEAAITASCMRKKGLDYPVAEAIAKLPAPHPPRLAGLGTPIDPETADRAGYGPQITPAPGSDPAENAEAAYFEALSPTERRAYHRELSGGSGEVVVSMPSGARIGASSTGCAAEARRTLYGSIEAFLQVAYCRNEFPRVADTTMNSRTVRATLHAYEQSLRAAGYKFRTPQLARKAAEQRWGGTRPAAGPSSLEERDQAVADAEAQAVSRCNQAMDEVALAHALPWIRANERWLLDLAEVQAHALDVAAELTCS